jgi:hypothetical protein
MGVRLQYLNDSLKYQTITNPTFDQLEECVVFLNYDRRRGLILSFPYGELLITVTNDDNRVKLDWVHVSRDDLPRGTILDESQSDTETLDLKLDNGQVDAVTKRETITREKALYVSRYLLENDGFPDDVLWGPSCYDW